MASIQEHIQKIKEHLEEIDDAIEDGIRNKPATIGFHTSACSIEFLELYLHLANRIPAGKIIKHNWFKRPQKQQKKEPLAERRLTAKFLDKTKIYNLIYNIEEKRNNLVYGKSSISQIESVLDSFLKLKKIMLEKLRKKGCDSLE